MTLFDESLIANEMPWAACIAMEEFLKRGGKCRVSDEMNWVGIAYTCEAKLDFGPEPPLQLHQALAWAHIAILIRESLASGFSPEESIGIITGAMWVRAKMIARCGNHPGDFICDCDKLVEWCIGLPSVQHSLKMTTIPAVLDIDPEARIIAEILVCLVQKGQLKHEGDVRRLLDLIAHAKETPREDTSEDLKVRAVFGEF